MIKDIRALANSYPVDSVEVSHCTMIADCIRRHGIDEAVHQVRLLRRHGNPRTNAFVTRALAILAPSGVPPITAPTREEIAAAKDRLRQHEVEVARLAKEIDRMIEDAAIALAEATDG